MNQPQTGLKITLPADAANVGLARHAMVGMAESAGMDPAIVADLKTVVSEACMNAVVHAYPDGEGLVSVDAAPEDDSMVIVVSDAGTGIQPNLDLAGSESSLKLGFSLIAALCSSFEIAGGLGQGTRITMRLPLSRSEQGNGAASADDEAIVPGEVRIVAARPELLPAVLPRAVSALGARRDLSIDQISDAVLLADAIAAEAPESFGAEEVNLSLSDGDGGIDIRVGPLAADRGTRLRERLKLPIPGGSIESLADDVRVESESDGEYLIFRVALDST